MKKILSIMLILFVVLFLVSCEKIISPDQNDFQVTINGETVGQNQTLDLPLESPIQLKISGDDVVNIIVQEYHYLHDLSSYQISSNLATNSANINLESSEDHNRIGLVMIIEFEDGEKNIQNSTIRIFDFG